uniref:Transmembrane protein 43 n=1 Tax=Eutreptiella gymnastica TaxID=73025 RepID=A0A7S1ITN9_9EUGL|mmetsp:Transcript_41035/g.73497  ORF Transcript_41035/g.73497 Transcript_41035/m.73497 type:complete len:411 (+) Transcript_41035:29-1261(+)
MSGPTFFPPSPTPSGGFQQQFPNRGGHTETFIDRSRRPGVGEQVKDVMCGVIFGIVLIFVSFGLLWWNEGSAVQVQEALDEVLHQVLDIRAGQVRPEFEAKLMCISGTISEQVITDDESGISVRGLRLQRSSEVFQWKEEVDERHENGPNGERVTHKTYRYPTQWSSHLIDSNRFKETKYPPNPTYKAVETRTFEPHEISMEAFLLPPALVAKLSGARTWVPQSEGFTLSGFHFYRVGDQFYSGSGSYNAPQVGDLRVSYSVVPAGQATIIGVQRGREVHPYRAKNGRTVHLLLRGIHDSASIIRDEQSTNMFWTWLLRVGGFILMWTGLGMVMGPLDYALSWIPILGGLGRFALSLGTFTVAGVLSSLTIAMAWIWCRPIVTAILIGGVIVFVYATKPGSTDPGKDKEP